MTLNEHQAGGRRIAEVMADGLLITTPSDALDLLGNVYYQGFDGMILHVNNITPAFLDLRNGMAGEVLQKFSNYRMKLAIIGNLGGYESKALQDFIRESNQGKLVNFRTSVEEALRTIFA